ncbi:MAG: T9SS type A sorting domain-containing protein, partial [Bacteroidales bacterium]
LPIEGATIEVMNTPVNPATTNENGEYTIQEIYENTYEFKVYALDYATVIQEVSIDAQNSVVDFELTQTNAVSFEAGIFEQGWSFGGDADWTIDNTTAWDGVYSAKSGNIGDNQTTTMMYSMEVASAGVISFYRKVSSESGYDYLQFYIDNTLQDEWAGELDWQEVTYNVSAGTHTFKWVYEKDSYVSSGDDCGWIDFIIFPPAAAVNAQAGPGGEICEGENFQCSGSAAYYTSVEWTTGGDGSFSDPSVLDPVYEPGTADIAGGNVELILTAYDDDGNSDSDQLQLIINPLPAEGTPIDGETEVCAGGTINYNCETIEHAISYVWSVEPEEAGIIESQNQNQITVLWNDGYYDEASIKVQGLNDCGAGEWSPELIVTVEDCTGTDELENRLFSIYPNPAGDVVSVKINRLQAENFRVSILDNNGRKLAEAASDDTGIATMDLSALESGVYLVRINDGTVLYARKIIVR